MNIVEKYGFAQLGGMTRAQQVQVLKSVETHISREIMRKERDIDRLENEHEKLVGERILVMQKIRAYGHSRDS